MVNIGDKVRIVYMAGEPQYEGKEGIVTSIQDLPWGETHIRGTWGGRSIIPEAGDVIEVIHE